MLLFCTFLYILTFKYVTMNSVWYLFHACDLMFWTKLCIGRNTWQQISDWSNRISVNFFHVCNLFHISKEVALFKLLLLCNIRKLWEDPMRIKRCKIELYFLVPSFEKSMQFITAYVFSKQFHHFVLFF